MSILDTEVFPRTNEYDLNLWLDDDGYFRISSYELAWESQHDTDEEGNPLYVMTNEYNGNDTLICVDTNDAEMMKAFGLTLSDCMEDEWTTSSFFEDEYHNHFTKTFMDAVSKQIDAMCVPYEARVLGA